MTYKLPKREMKFRAWNLETKTMHYASKEPHTDDEGYLWKTVLLLDYDGWSIWRVPENVWYRGVKADERELLVNYENGILMQYTGLKDRKGNDIYEGDILGEDDKVFAVVVWIAEQTRFGLMFPPFDSVDKSRMALMDWFDHWQYTDWQVIGNIFENSDLLNNNDG